MTKPRLRLFKPQQFTTPSEAVESIRNQVIDDLVARGYDQDRAERLAAMCIRPDLILAYSGAGARRTDLPGGQPAATQPDQEDTTA